ncbi:MAG: PilT/PilU family type 4a pilus ATPase [Alphaproteobacteria bacterium]|nr:PilT/PilU family type 4a pilus ATPase [Alphaproteobacteria bacterium]
MSLDKLFDAMIQTDASDLYLTVGSAPTLRINEAMTPQGSPLTFEHLTSIVETLLNARQLEEFHRTMELNIAYRWGTEGRFRMNFFYQQQMPGVVIRRIRTVIPTAEQLGLPPIYTQTVMEKRGLVLLVGPTGSGKSSSLAAMLHHRNLHGSGHVITIEDPIEFVHDSKNCLFTQREVGLDTGSFGAALKNTLRQRPDIVLIGEIRDEETMDHAITFSETGHLCLATLHASNANQAIERILSFFTPEKQRQLLLNLSLNLKAIMSQRLLPTLQGGRCVAVEILLNKGVIRQYIQEGKIREIKEAVSKQRDEGMQTFDQALIDLYIQGLISEEQAIAEADNPTDLKLKLRTSGSTPKPPQAAQAAGMTPAHINALMPTFRS